MFVRKSGRQRKGVPAGQREKYLWDEYSGQSERNFQTCCRTKWKAFVGRIC